jgi:hypothetical protein
MFDEIATNMNKKCIPTKREDREGNCYEISSLFVLSNDCWLLVHATLYPRSGPFANRAYQHAFVESGDWVYDPIFDTGYPRDMYYAYHRVSEARRYNAEEMKRMLLKTENYGPWNDTEC